MDRTGVHLGNVQIGSKRARLCDAKQESAAIVHKSTGIHTTNSDDAGKRRNDNAITLHIPEASEICLGGGNTTALANECLLKSIHRGDFRFILSLILITLL